MLRHSKVRKAEAEPSYYGIAAEPLAPSRLGFGSKNQPCVTVISAQKLYGSVEHPYAALEKRRPDAIVGTSLFVFRHP